MQLLTLPKHLRAATLTMAITLFTPYGAAQGILKPSLANGESTTEQEATLLPLPVSSRTAKDAPPMDPYRRFDGRDLVLLTDFQGCLKYAFPRFIDYLVINGKRPKRTDGAQRIEKLCIEGPNVVRLKDYALPELPPQRNLP